MTLPSSDTTGPGWLGATRASPPTPPGSATTLRSCDQYPHLDDRGWEDREAPGIADRAALAAVEALLGNGNRAGLDAASGNWADVATAAGATHAITTAAGGAVRWDLRGFLADAEAAAREARGDEAYDSL